MQKHLVEIKATSTHHDRQREALLAAGAEFHGLDHQVDRYFRVPEGRLKLRTGHIENSLIFYRRPDTAAAKDSAVTLTRLESTTARELAGTLEAALGSLVTVDKQREIYFIGNVKFHLDTVEQLGTFVEIEAIGESAGERDALKAQVDRYAALLGVSDSDLQSVSYSDLLLQRSAGGRSA